MRLTVVVCKRETWGGGGFGYQALGSAGCIRGGSNEEELMKVTKWLPSHPPAFSTPWLPTPCYTARVTGLQHPSNYTLPRLALPAWINNLPTFLKCSEWAYSFYWGQSYLSFQNLLVCDRGTALLLISYLRVTYVRRKASRDLFFAFSKFPDWLINNLVLNTSSR